VTDRVAQDRRLHRSTLLTSYPALLVGLTFGANNGWTSPLVIVVLLWLRSVFEFRVDRTICDKAAHRR
jgi:hypothetical protein